MAKEELVDQLLEILEKNVHSDTNDILSVWSCLDCLIESGPEAPNHNTFVLTFRMAYFNKVKAVIENAFRRDLMSTIVNYTFC